MRARAVPVAPLRSIAEGRDTLRQPLGLGYIQIQVHKVPGDRAEPHTNVWRVAYGILDKAIEYVLGRELAGPVPALWQAVLRAGSYRVHAQPVLDICLGRRADL